MKKLILLVLLVPLTFLGIMKPVEDFIIGVDLSMLYEIEKMGGKFYENGIQKDCLEILRNNGVNWVRLRIWNDPADESGNPLGGGNCTYINMTEIAQRAKKLGMKVLVDFHYSDWWADPGKQNKPKAWKNLHGEDLKKALYQYTKDVLKYMKDHQALPDMVQIGNEINNGFLWPDGQIFGQGSGGFDGLAALLKEAIKAVREIDPRIRVMIHLAEGGNNSLFRWFFDALVKRGIEFDVIGVSYYPYWHGTLQDLSSNLNDISVRYDKDVVIVETAYAWTLDDADGYTNIFGIEQISGYKPTVRGQRSFLRDLIMILRSVSENRGIGFFYWEGAWIPVKGVGWKDGEGNPWENQTLFDFTGNVLDSIEIFNQSIETIKEIAEAEEISDVKIEIFLGEKLKLPQTVKVSFSDDTIKSLKVDWQEVDLKIGENVVRGKIPEIDKEIGARVIVKDRENYILNPSFETGIFDPWKIKGESKAVKVVVANPIQNAHHGQYAVNYWLDKDFEFEMYQVVENIPHGVYTLSMWIQGSGGDDVQLMVSDYGGPDQIVHITNTGWLKWNNPSIRNIEIVSGRIKVSIIVKGRSGNWGWIDQFELLKVK